ncbi:MAG: FAD-dependent oxidoreductase, partial [Alphaproteobacteria bacterium]|nr:FAD-dependent oxidoreductase [Alphaproteobacteria bacterium]
MPLNVAIVGAGPGGFYTAAALIKEIPDCKVDVIDKLPTPFGLIRAGVAPDHQSSKKIAKVFERTAMEDNVRFLGHVAVGNKGNGGDVSVDELREMYDAVVIAIGAPEDRKLGIPGEDLNGVFGSAAFVGWYNANPDHESLGPDLTTGTAVVIGAGNVALDVARLIAKTQEEVSVTDMADHAVDEIGRSPLTDVYIYARRGPLQAAFTHKEVKEFGDLHNAVTLVDPAVLPPEDAELDDKGRGNSAKNVALMRDYAKNKGDEKPVRIHMEFYARPVEVLGSGKVEAIKMERTEVKDDGACVGTGEFFEMPCNLVVTCIGTSSVKLDDVPYDEDKQRFINEDGKIEEGLYAAGWAKRGPTGTIATNHPDGVVVAE